MNQLMLSFECYTDTDLTLLNYIEMALEVMPFNVDTLNLLQSNCILYQINWIENETHILSNQSTKNDPFIRCSFSAFTIRNIFMKQ